MHIKIITTGGTIDKIYFDRKSDYEVGASNVEAILSDANVTIDYEVRSLMQKDSLDMTDEDRELICSTIEADDNDRFLVTHGTDTMLETARMLKRIPDKVIVLTGSMQPALFKSTDAVFNVGCALIASEILPPGVYIVMNGRVFEPGNCRKNRDANRFEAVEPVEGE